MEVLTETKHANLKYALTELGIDSCNANIYAILDAIKRDKKNLYVENKTTKIKEIIDGFLNVDLFDRSRNRTLVRARHFFCFIVYYKTNTPVTEIGEFLGLDHSTIVHGIKTLKNIYSVDKSYREEFLQLLNLLDIAGIGVDRVRFEVEKISVKNQNTIHKFTQGS